MNGALTKTRVLRLRLKDKHAKFLRDLAREVNFVWNYCNELQITVFNREHRFLSGYDFAKFTRGATKEGLHLHSQTVQAIAEEYATRRRQFRKVRLRWRRSTGSRCSLGWIPFKKTAIQAAHGQVKFAGRWLSLWDSYGLDAYAIRVASLCEDARGRWYLNACVAVPVTESTARSSTRRELGIDLGWRIWWPRAMERNSPRRNYIAVLSPSSPSRNARARRTVCARSTPKSRIAGKIPCISSQLAWCVHMTRYLSET
jgi:putative transposase